MGSTTTRRAVRRRSGGSCWTAGNGGRCRRHGDHHGSRRRGPGREGSALTAKAVRCQPSAVSRYSAGPRARKSEPRIQHSGPMMELEPADIYRRLQAQIGPDAKLDEPMWRHTSFRVGGPAHLFVRVQSSRMLEHLVPLIAGRGVSWRVLGGGTNVLVAEAGIRGCILSVEGDKPELELIEERAPSGGVPEAVARIQAGCRLIPVARKAVDLGLGGLEWAIGLPGTVGGAVVNNAGAHGSGIAAIFRSGTAVDSSGAMISLSPEDMAYSYRYSAFKGGRHRDMAVISVELRLSRGSRDELLEVATRFDNARKLRQPPGLLS